MNHSFPAFCASVLLLGAFGSRAQGATDVEVHAFAHAEFAATCARCHQADGSGFAPLGIPSFLDQRWQADHPDAELLAAIHNGRNGKMPPFGAAYTSPQIDALVDYIRGLAPKATGKPHGPLPPPPPPVAIEPSLPAPGHGAGPVVLGSVGLYTQHNDNARTGANLHETILTPANVNPRQFGLLFRHVLDNEVFAQPLYVPNLEIGGGRHNVVIVASAANTVYAFDADVDAPAYWQVSLGSAGSVEQHHFWCLDIVGDMGVVGTPVIDPATQTMYVVALTHENNGFVQRLHALDLHDGSDRPHSPVTLTAPGFDPLLNNQRPALLLSQGGIYIGFSSHCDVGPYHGFLMRYDPRSLQQTAVLNLSPDGDGNSIWQSGQGPAADEDGTIFFVTSNGIWDGKRNFSDSFLKVSPDLKIEDWFTPTNYQELDKKDHDLNSIGAMLIPGTHEVMGAGKEGVVYVINRDNFGHLGDEHAAQRFKATKGEVNVGAVYWKSAGGEFIYLWGQDDALHAYAFRDGRFEPKPVGVGAATSAYPGGILSLSANGDRDGVLWANAALTAHGGSHINGAGVLRAYDATDVTHELWDSNLDAAHNAPGRVSKNAPPTVVNGKVYLASFGTLPADTGALYVYGLLPLPPAP